MIPRNKKIQILNVILLLIIAGCSTSKVVVDYDEKVNFEQFTSFEFYEDNGDSLNEFDVKRITTSILNTLEAKGLSKKDTPDFYIYFDATVAEVANNNSIGIGSGGRNGGVGISGGIPIGGKKLSETIIIKFIAAASNSLLWEGSLTSTINEKRIPKERRLHLEAVVARILEAYPPKK